MFLGEFKRFCLVRYLLLSLSLHCLLLLFPVQRVVKGSAWSYAIFGRTSLQVVQLRSVSDQSAPAGAGMQPSEPAAEQDILPEPATPVEASVVSIPLFVPSSQLSVHPVLLNGEVLEEGAAVFPPELSARVVVDVLVNEEGRVERVWQKGEMSEFALWLGEQLVTKVRFRPAELDGSRVRTVLRMEFSLAHGVAPQEDRNAR